MIKQKKAQGIAIAVFLLIIVIILMTAVLTYFILNSISLQPATSNVIKEEKTEITCPSQYIQIGNNCCLDRNYNRICDSDEPESKPVSTCEYPYIEKGNTCCLDRDDNGRCDIDEDYADEYAYLNSPFRLVDFDIREDEIKLEIRNRDDVDIIIKTIDIEDCDRIHPDETIREDGEETFYLDCDLEKYFNSDIELDYTKGNSTEVLTSSGRIRNDRYYDDYRY